jgi:hypothetical protein
MLSPIGASFRSIPLILHILLLLQFNKSGKWRDRA